MEIIDDRAEQKLIENIREVLTSANCYNMRSFYLYKPNFQTVSGKS